MEIVVAADCIFHVHGLISGELCRSLVALYERDAAKRPGHTVASGGALGIREEVKVSTDLEIRAEGEWAAAHDELHRAVTRVVMSLAAQFPSLQVWPLQWSGYKLQHYRKDEGHFKWHFDALGPGGWERQLAMIIYLNTVESGGETSFHRQKLQVNPVEGEALFFPTFWTHMHCGEIPRSQDKFVISSFVSFLIPAG